MATLKRTPLSMKYGVEAACGERMRHLHSMIYRAAIAIAGTAADTIADSYYQGMPLAVKPMVRA